MPWVMMWLAVEYKWAYMVSYYNSSKICYCHHFEHLFFFFYWIKLILNVYILMLCLLVFDLT